MCGCVGHDVSACGAHRVAEEGLRISLHLIGDYDCEVEGLSDTEELVEMAVQTLLSLAEGLSTNIFAAAVCEDGVDDQQFDVFSLADLESVIDSQYLMVAIVNATVDDAIENLVSILPASLGHLEYSLGRESSFRVDEEDFSLQSSFCGGKLSLNTQFHRDLRFARAKFADELGDSLSLKSTTQQGVEVARPKAEAEQRLTSLP